MSVRNAFFAAFYFHQYLVATEKLSVLAQSMYYCVAQIGKLQIRYCWSSENLDIVNVENGLKTQKLDIKCKKVVLLVFVGQIKWGQSLFSKIIVLHLPYYKIIFIAWTDILKMRYGRTPIVQLW